MRVSLTTGFSAMTRDRLLAALGWSSLADLALSPDSSLRGRPAPDLVLASVIRLRVDDVRAVAVVGDTVNDLLSGLRAGASVVAGVLTGAHDASVLASVPHTHLLEIDRRPPSPGPRPGRSNGRSLAGLDHVSWGGEASSLRRLGRFRR